MKNSDYFWLVMLLFLVLLICVLMIDSCICLVDSIFEDIKCNGTYYVDLDNNEGKAEYCDRNLVCRVNGVNIQAKKVYYKNVCIIDKDTMKN